ncbi:MAG: hypothetical protein NT124_04980 [Candidatus Dependentiae bacterium]|nr:hypothetical protein [Candidatus Dependentiae bacterium]
MMNLKNKAGFLTFEALMAMSIVGFMITPLIVMEISALTQVAKKSRALERLFLMKRFLLIARREQKDEPQSFTFNGTESDPATDLVYTLNPVPQTSALSSVHGLLHEKVEAIDTTNNKKQTSSIISFIYRPEPEKEQENS